MAPRRNYYTLLALTLLTGPLVAQQPDPLDLLRQSAEAVAEADSLTVTLDATTTVVRDGQTETDATRYTLRTAPGERFEFATTGDAEAGVQVAGNGRVLLTHAIAAQRHALSPGAGGVGALATSPAASTVGSGLGGMVLSLLTPSTADALAASLTASEYVALERLDGAPAHHARYTVGDALTFDAWFAAEGAPVVLRVVPDLAATPSVQRMAQQHESFEYRLVFDFKSWNLSAALEDADIHVEEPSDSLLVGTLFAPPTPGPNPLLGQDAPAFKMSTPGGERVDLAEHFGDGVVLLEFWASHCSVCLKAMPKIEELHRRYADRGVEYFAINSGESPGDVAAFLERRGASPLTLVDESIEVASAYNVSRLPVIVLVDAAGKVQVAQVGFVAGDEEKLADAIEALLAGEDLAAPTLAEHREAEAARRAEQERLRAALDG